MAIFKREKEEAPVVQMTEDSWIWVDGYKGTDKNMQCHDYQYVLGVTHEMPEDVEIKLCESGFHLCLELKDVFNYYKLGDGNRYFKVRALVRASELGAYGKCTSLSALGRNKLTSKAILFEREMSPEEIFEAYNRTAPIPKMAIDFTHEEMLLALEKDIRYVKIRRDAQDLVKYGYAEGLAMYICGSQNQLKDFAIALGSQTDISMDTRVAILFQCFNTNVQLTEIYNSSRRGRTI